MFKTGDMPYAGTDANVTLQLFGDKGQTEKIMLRQESGKTLKRFDRGRTDRFTVQTMDVGKVSEYFNSETHTLSVYCDISDKKVDKNSVQIVHSDQVLHTCILYVQCTAEHSI